MHEPKCSRASRPFGPLCGNRAAYVSPLGDYLCESCAEEVKRAIASGETLLNIIAENRGVSIEVLLSKFVPLN